MSHCPSLGPLSPVPEGSEQVEAQATHHVPVALRAAQGVQCSVATSPAPGCLNVRHMGMPNITSFVH